MRRLPVLVLLCASLATSMSCGGDKGPTGPSGPGTLEVRLVAPPGTLDTAIVFTISGPAPLTSVTAGSGLRLFQGSMGGSSTNFALIGPLANGTVILTIGVQDLAHLSQYRGLITGVAQPSFELRDLPGGYALALTR